MKDKKEYQYPVASVTRSYSEKVNTGNYQSKDFFASRSYSWFYEPKVEEVEGRSVWLYQRCYEDVQRAIAGWRLETIGKDKAKEDNVFVRGLEINEEMGNE